MTVGTTSGRADGEFTSQPPGSLRTQRLRWTWLLVPPFFLVAQPAEGALLLGALLAAWGLLLRAAAAVSILKEQDLATGGPYAFVRHPLYLGSFLIGGGLAVASARWWMIPLFVMGFLLLYIPVVRREERHLERVFGEAYRRYRDRIPAVVPWPGRRWAGGGTGGFRISRYLRNSEWEAALGVVAGFGFLWLKMVWVG